MGRAEGSIWSVRAFRGLWMANAVEHAGHAVAMFAVSVAMITVLGASEWEAGLVAPLSSAGPLLVGLVAGVAVDRWGRRWTMFAMTWVRAAAYACAVFAFWAGWLAAWHLLAVLAVVSIADSFFTAAQTSLLPRLVGRPRIPGAASSLMATDQVISLVGPAASGQLVKLLPAPVVLGVSALAQLAAAMGLARLPADDPPVSKAERQGVGEAIADGWRFMTRHRLLLAMVLTTATNNFSAGVYQAAESWFILKELAMDPAVFGAVWSVSAVGGIFGALAAPWLGRAIGPLRAMMLAGVMMPVNFALIPLTALWPQFAVLTIGVSFALFGLALGLMSVNGTALFTELTPDSLLSRFSATRRTITQGSFVAGGLLGAALLGWIGAVPTLWVAVAGAMLQGVFLLRVGVPRRGTPLPSELPEESAV